MAELQLLRAGPYLTCIPEAFLHAVSEPDIATLRSAPEIWSFQSDALFHESLRSYRPIGLLIEALALEVSNFARVAPSHTRSATRTIQPILDR